MDKHQKIRRKNIRLFDEWLEQEPKIQKIYANNINKRIRKINKYDSQTTQV